MRVEDRITGVNGVVSSISFDLYGCVQAIVTPAGTDKDGNQKKCAWFDVSRLNVLSETPVMDRPSFVEGPFVTAEKGPAEKPDFNETPMQ